MIGGFSGSGEFARRIGVPEWDEVTQVVEQAAYRPQAPGRSLAERVQALVKGLKVG